MSQLQPQDDNIGSWIRGELQPFLRQYFDRGRGAYDTFDDEVQPIRRLLELLVHSNSHPFDLVHALQAITVSPATPLYPTIVSIAQDPRTVIALSIWYQLHHGGLSLRNNVYYAGFPLPAQGMGSPDFQNAVWTIRNAQPGPTCPRCGYAGIALESSQVPINPGHNYPVMTSAQPALPSTGLGLLQTNMPSQDRPESSHGRGASSTHTGRSKRNKRGRGRGRGSGVGGFDGAMDDDDNVSDQGAIQNPKRKVVESSSVWSHIKKFFRRKANNREDERAR